MVVTGRGRLVIVTTAMAAALLACPVMLPAQEWTTHRGNPQRTGTMDDKAGPDEPRVLWAYKAPEQFIASPVPLGPRPADSAAAPGAGARMLVSSLGAFNTGVFRCLSAAGDSAGAELWSKSAPLLKRPMVCAPAIANDVIVFGDGMHQTDEGTVYGMSAKTGRMIWQFEVPGKLVHLEGSPTLLPRRIFIGGGQAGVLCLHAVRLLHDGQEIELPAAINLIDSKWAELVAKYEQDRKQDAELAVPPSEAALPRISPRLLWQAGKDAWHVDAPLGLAGDRLLVASAYLDDEKSGKRALICLNSADGAVQWETPLTLNPWSGPTVAGDLVLVGCSSIRFDRKLLNHAGGEVMAIELASGKVRWQKLVPGGVLGSVAVSGNLAVFAATDGKVRALDVATGEQKWVYEAGNPFFAAPSIAAGVVYAADLKGVLHAMKLSDGKAKWFLDVPNDPAVQTPGACYGSPLVWDGRIYLATCTIDSEAADKPGAVVCIGPRGAAVPQDEVKLVVDKSAGQVAIPARIAPRKLATLKEVYPIEVIATWPAPRGQKAHETIVTISAAPSDVHRALESLGLKAGSPAKGEEEAAIGPQVQLLLQIPGPDGPRQIPVEQALIDLRTGRPIPRLTWRFTGSSMRQPDPQKDVRVYGADLSGTLAAVFPVTDETVFQSNLTMREASLLRLEVDRSRLPPEGERCTMIVRKARPNDSATAAAGASGFLPPTLLSNGPGVAGGRELYPLSKLTWLPIPPLRRDPVQSPDGSGRPAGQAVPPNDSQVAPRDFAATPPMRAPSAGGPAAGPPNRASDPLILPVRWSDPEKKTTGGDTTVEMSWELMLRSGGGLRSGTYRFMKLEIPDPTEIPRQMELSCPPVDRFGPASDSAAAVGPTPAFAKDAPAGGS